MSIKIGDRVRRIVGVGVYADIGTVCEITERPSRKTERQQQTIEMRIRVAWDIGGGRVRRTWLAMSGEGIRWERLVDHGEIEGSK